MWRRRRGWERRLLVAERGHGRVVGRARVVRVLAHVVGHPIELLARERHVVSFRGPAARSLALGGGREMSVCYLQRCVRSGQQGVE